MYNVKCRTSFSLAAVAMVLLLPGAAAFAAGTGAYSPELVGGIADVQRCTVPCGPALCIVRPCTAHASANGTALGANVQREREDIPALVTEGVTFFVSIIVFYFFVGTAATVTGVFLMYVERLGAEALADGAEAAGLLIVVKEDGVSGSCV